MSEAHATPPPWGFLPVEQYLIRQWDAESSLSPDEQRSALVDEFLGRDVIDSAVYASIQEPDKVSRVPTQPEVDEILKPLRPQAIRKIAPFYNAGSGTDTSFIFLRTHYGASAEDEQKIMDDWLRDDANGEPCVYPEDRWWKLLNDAEHFNLGRDWQRVYKFLPELAVPCRDRTPIPFEDMPFDDMTFAEVLDDEYEIYLSYLVSRSVMIIFDEEFFETKKVCLVFRDTKGIPIRVSRIRTGEVASLDAVMTIKASLDDSEWWNEGVTGQKYRSLTAEP